MDFEPTAKVLQSLLNTAGTTITRQLLSLFSGHTKHFVKTEQGVILLFFGGSRSSPRSPHLFTLLSDICLILRGSSEFPAPVGLD